MFARMVPALAGVALVLSGFSVAIAQEPEPKELAKSGSWSVSSDGEFCTIVSNPERGQAFIYRTNMDFGYRVGLTSTSIVLDESNRDKVKVKVEDREVPVVRLYTLFGVLGDAPHFDVIDDQGNSERFETEGLADVKPYFARCMNRLKGLVTRGPFPKLVSFDGGEKLMRTAGSLGLLRQRLGFALAVSATGEITDCRLSRSFRRATVSKSLCKVLKEHHVFEPAVNAKGEPVRGVYDGELLMYSVLG